MILLSLSDPWPLFYITEDYLCIDTIADKPSVNNLLKIKSTIDLAVY